MFVNYAVGLNEFYELLGLEKLPEYESLGWSCGKIGEMYWHPWIEFEHSVTPIDENLECTIINLPLAPFIDYLEY